MKTRVFYLLVFLLFLVLYYPSLNCGFFSDDYVNLNLAQNSSIFHSDSYSINNFFIPFDFLFKKIEYYFWGDVYFFYQLVNFCLIFLSFIFFNKIITRISEILNSKIIYYSSFFSPLIFCVFPYNTEAVNWYSAQHYLCATLLFLMGVQWYLKAKISNLRKDLFISTFLFLFSILFKEITIIFPLIILIIDFAILKQKVKAIFIQQFTYLLIIGLYFILRKYFIGEFIGGYGELVHLNFNFQLLSHNLMAYLSKFFFLHRYIPKEIRIHLYYIVPILILIFLKTTSNSNAVFKGKLKIFLIIVVSVIVALFPVLTLETSFLHSIQSDRYGYLPSIFVSIFFGYLIALLYSEFSFLNKKLRILGISSIILFIISLGYCTFSTNIHWGAAANIRDEFVRFSKNSKIKKEGVIILNIPDNYEGVYIFRNGFEQFLLRENCYKNIKYFLKFEMCREQGFDVRINVNEYYFKMTTGMIYNVNHDLFKINRLSSRSIYFEKKSNAQVFYYDGFTFSEFVR